MLDPPAPPLTAAEAAARTKKIAALHGSIRAHKGHFTRRTQSVTRCLPLVTANSSPAAAKVLEEEYRALDDRYNRVLLVYDELLDLMVTKEEQDDVHQRMADLDEEFQGTRHHVLQALNEARAPRPAPAQAPEGARVKRTRVNAELRPEKLTVQMTPCEFRTWMDRFGAYYSTSDMDVNTVVEQQAYLFACLEPVIERKIKEFIDAQTPVYGPNGCMARIEEVFMEKYPLFTRRLAFFRYTQQSGQTFSDFVAELQRRGDEASLATMTEDEFYVFRFITGCTDMRLRGKFTKRDNPTLKDLKAIVVSYEIGNNTDYALGSKQTSVVEPLGEVNKVEPGRRPPNSGHDRQPRQVVCFRCGEQEHVQRKCPKDAAGFTCDNCGKAGHVSSVCIRRAQVIGNAAARRASRGRD